MLCKTQKREGKSFTMNVFDAIRVGDTITLRSNGSDEIAFEVTPKIHKALFVWVGLATVSSVATGYEDDMHDAQTDVINALDAASGGILRASFGETEAADRINEMLEYTFFENYDESVHATGYSDLSEPSFWQLQNKS